MADNIFADIAGPLPSQTQATTAPYDTATAQQKQFLADNGATYDRSRLAPDVVFDTPTQTATNQPHVTTQGVLETPGVDAAHNVFADLAPRRHDDILGFQQMALKPLDNAASWLEDGLRTIGVPVDAIDKALGTPSADAVKQAHLNYLKGQAAVGVDPGIAGQIAGGMVGTLPLALLPGGALTQGALGGAALSDAHDAKGLVTDASIGAVGGKIGEGLVGAAKGVLDPQISAAQQYLLNRGIRLTPGQIAGGGFKRLEDTLTSVPVVGDLIKSAQARSVNDFNRAAVNETLSPIGKSLPTNVDTGHEAVAHATRTLGDAYDTALSKVPSVAPDATFVSNMSKIGQDATSGIMPEPQVNQFKAIIQQRVLNRLDANSNGQTMKLVDSDLATLARKYSVSPDAAQGQLGDALEATRSELRDLVQRTNPQVADDLAKINTGWARLVRVQKAAGSSSSAGGVFTPAQFNAAVVNSGSKSQASQGAALMQQLSDAGKDVLPSKIPDSGTAGRSAMMLMGGAMLGGHAVHIEPQVALAAAALAGPYLGVGQSAMRAAMTSRPAAVRAAAQYLSRLKAPAVAAGATGAVGARQAWSQP